MFHAFVLGTKQALYILGTHTSVSQFRQKNVNCWAENIWGALLLVTALPQNGNVPTLSSLPVMLHELVLADVNHVMHFVFEND